MTIDRPNQVFGIDTLRAYIRLHGGWLYMVAVIDWYSRYIVAWELDQTLEMDFVLSTVDRALAIAKPEIWNSDQGSHFTSPQYIERLLAAQVRISMDGKGRATDNIFTERFWRSVKYEDALCTSMTTSHHARRTSVWAPTRTTTTWNDRINRWATGRQHRCTLDNGRTRTYCFHSQSRWHEAESR
jgi:putative transposase